MKNDSGTAISKSIDGVWKLIFVLVIACLSWQVQAACTFFDGFIDNKDGTVTDPRNGLIWKRCAEGFEWNGSKCLGSSKQVNWFDAMKIAKQSRFLGKADWRIPGKAEFEAVVGKNDVCEDNKYKPRQYAASRSIAHAVYADTGGAGSFWSSHGLADMAGYFDFVDGFAGDIFRVNTYHVRLVRSGQSSGEKSALEFNTEYAKIDQYKKEFAAKEAARAKEQDREDARRAKADRQRIATACDRFYPGKAIGFKPGGAIYQMFNTVLDAVVLGKGGGNVSIKIVATNDDNYGKTLEVSCASDQLQ